MKEKTLQVFCANCQNDTPHTGEVDLNGELVFTCSDCGRFLKVPVGMTVEEIHTHFANHREVNAGQVSVAQSHAVLDDVFAAADESKSTKSKAAQ